MTVILGLEAKLGQSTATKCIHNTSIIYHPIHKYAVIIGTVIKFNCPAYSSRFPLHLTGVPLLSRNVPGNPFLQCIRIRDTFRIGARARARAMVVARTRATIEARVRARAMVESRVRSRARDKSIDMGLGLELGPGLELRLELGLELGLGFCLGNPGQSQTFLYTHYT